MPVKKVEKPKKKTCLGNPDWMLYEHDKGYNQACDDWQAYHDSVVEPVKTLYKKWVGKKANIIGFVKEAWQVIKTVGEE